jgi:protein-tyrosine phosphatase
MTMGLFFKAILVKKFSILFACYGNICRSPSAQGVLRKKLSESSLRNFVTVDSAATHDLHPGDPPDVRSQEHALRRGYDLSDLRARQASQSDAENFDLVLVMDKVNFEDLKQIWPTEQLHKIQVITEHCSKFKVPGVPDPYYGEPSDFELVLDILEDASIGILKYVEQRLKSPE